MVRAGIRADLWAKEELARFGSRQLWIWVWKKSVIPCNFSGIYCRQSDLYLNILVVYLYLNSSQTHFLVIRFSFQIDICCTSETYALKEKLQINSTLTGNNHCEESPSFWVQVNCVFLRKLAGFNHRSLLQCLLLLTTSSIMTSLILYLISHVQILNTPVIRCWNWRYSASLRKYTGLHFQKENICLMF